MVIVIEVFFLVNLKKCVYLKFIKDNNEINIDITKDHIASSVTFKFYDTLNEGGEDE